MSNNLRKEVLSIFKQLHRTRRKVFDGDERALIAGRQKINNEFKSKKHITDQESIAELVNLAKNVEIEIRQSVVQAKEVKPNVYELRITEETYKSENFPYRDDVEIPKRRPGKPKCCKT